MKNYVDGGEAILEALRNLDVDYIMSSPGSEWGPVWEALGRQQIGNKAGPGYIHCWHETLAVNLAWGYTAVTGRLQAVMLHAGAGLLQGSMGINAATASRTPMLVLSGESLSFGADPDFDPGRQWYNSLSIVGGPHRLLEPLVKWSNQATSPATLYEQVVRAGEMARRTPAGPTYLNVPIENMLHEWTPPAKMGKVPPTPKPRPSDADIESVAKLLLAAENPVITTESIASEADGLDAMVDLCELLAIPVVESYVAKFTNFPKDHALHQGFEMEPFLDDADLVMTVRSCVPWYPPSNCPKNATIVSVEESPFRENMVYQSLQADIFLEGDAVASLQLLADAVRAMGVDAARVEARRARWQAAHDKRREGLGAAVAEARDKSPIDPVWLCAAMSEALPDNAVYVDETTTHRRAIQNHLRCNRAHDYVKVPTGLGQGLGCALGVKLALPDRPVISIIGDGGFLYNPVTQSLGLSKDANLPIMIVVFNNTGYSAMRNNQLSYYPDGTGKQHNLFFGHPINGPDYAELVKPFGGFGRKVEDPAELISALQDGLAAVEDGRTAIINVVLNA